MFDSYWISSFVIAGIAALISMIRVPLLYLPIKVLINRFYQIFYFICCVLAIITAIVAIVIFTKFFLLKPEEDYSDCCYKANDKYANDVLGALQTSAIHISQSGRHAQVLQSKIDIAIAISDKRFSGNLKNAINYYDLNERSQAYATKYTTFNDDAENFDSFMETLKLSLSSNKSTSCYKKIDRDPSLVVMKPVSKKMEQMVEPFTNNIKNGLNRQFDNLQSSWTNYNKTINGRTEKAKKVIEQNVKSFQDLFSQLENKIATSNTKVKLERDYSLLDLSMHWCQVICPITFLFSLVPIIEYISNVWFKRIQTIPKWLQWIAYIITVAMLIITSVLFATTLLFDIAKPDDDCPAQSRNAILSSFSMRYMESDFKTTAKREYDSICKSSNDSILSDINIDGFFSSDAVLRSLDLQMYKSKMTLMIAYGGIVKLQIDKEFTKQLKTFNSLIDFLNSLLEESCLDANQKNTISQHKEKFENFVNSSKTFEDDVNRYNERIQSPKKVTDVLFEGTRKSIDSEIKLALDGIKGDLAKSNLNCAKIMKFESLCSHSVNIDDISSLVIFSFSASLVSIIFQTIPAPLTETQEKDRKAKECLKRERKLKREQKEMEEKRQKLKQERALARKLRQKQNVNVELAVLAKPPEPKEKEQDPTGKPKSTMTPNPPPKSSEHKRELYSGKKWKTKNKNCLKYPIPLHLASLGNQNYHRQLLNSMKTSREKTRSAI